MEYEDKLRQWKKEIDNAKTIIAQTQGSMNTILKSLKNDYGIDSIKDAETELTNLEKSRNILSKKIETLITKIQKTYFGDV